WVLNAESKFVKENISISEALLKAFDEILVNAIDQYIRSIEFSIEKGGPVTIIVIKFNNKTGEISIFNDGKGIPIYFMEKVDQYSVQAIISEEFSGSNFDDKENPDRVVGGVNGLGIKLININSAKFEIETVDWKRKLYYRQVCSNNMDIIEKPVVINLNKSKETKDLDEDQKRPHTTVRFIPDYTQLCQESNESPGNWFSPKNLNKFQKIIEARVYQTAAFISSINYRYEKRTNKYNEQEDVKIEYRKKAKIYFNDKEIKFKSLSEYAKLFGVEEVIDFEISGDAIISGKKGENIKTPIRFPWTICVGYAPNKELAGQSLSIVNGVFLPKGGSHVNMLYNQIGGSLKKQIDAIIDDSNVEFKSETAKINALKKMLFMIDVRQIPLPQFAGQTKDSITIGAKELNLMKKIYQIPPKISAKIWKMVKDAFEFKILQQDLEKSSKKRKRIKDPKHEAAEKLGIGSGLFIPEGDSAAKPIRDIITSKHSPINRKNHGIFSIQGVPPNAYKKIKKIIINGEKKIKQDKSLQNNEAFQRFSNALNLNYNFKYENTEEGDKEFSSLNYGYIIISTDQDLDGVGNICSLIVVYILTFWPDLIKRGFVKRLQTPLIRIYMPSSESLAND